MANYIGRPVTQVPDYMVKNVVIPAATLITAGNVVIANSLDATDGTRNLFAFAPTKPTTAGFAKYGVSVVLSPSFETLTDNRMPAGNPDYTTYTYKANDVATVVDCHAGMVFEISTDAIATPASATVGNFLIPTNNAFTLTATATEPSAGATASKTYFKILQTKDFRLGGLNANQYAKTVVCQVIEL